MSTKIAHNQIRCLLSTKVVKNRTINEYVLESGKHITEIVTDLGHGNTGVREIYRNSEKVDDIEKVVDKIFGRLEVFYPSKLGLIYEIDGVRCSLPNVSMNKLLKTVKL